jgi:hypothetical protein
LRAYMPRRIKRQRKIITQLIIGLVMACVIFLIIIFRYPHIIPGATDFLDQMKIRWDLATLPLAVKINVKSAEFWNPDLLIVDVDIENNSRFVILCKDLRLVDRQGHIFLPSSTSVYYVTRDQSLWMREINPGQKIKGKYAFTVTDSAFGLMFAVDTEMRLIRLQSIKEISRLY